MGKMVILYLLSITFNSSVFFKTLYFLAYSKGDMYEI